MRGQAALRSSNHPLKKAPICTKTHLSDAALLVEEHMRHMDRVELPVALLSRQCPGFLQHTFRILGHLRHVFTTHTCVLAGFSGGSFSSRTLWRRDREGCVVQRYVQLADGRHRAPRGVSYES